MCIDSGRVNVYHNRTPYRPIVYIGFGYFCFKKLLINGLTYWYEFYILIVSNPEKS